MRAKDITTNDEEIKTIRAALDAGADEPTRENARRMLDRMMRDAGYNGWRNYETWATRLHFDPIEDAVAPEQDEDEHDYAERIKNYVEESHADAMDGLPPFLSDISRLDKVDFDEIAAVILAE